MTVREALTVPVLRGAGPRVLAGERGLDRPVRWVHTTELVDIAPLLRGGDLVLSTGIALPEEGGDLAAFADSLDGSQAAGLVIELGRRWREVPDALVAACDRLGLPLVALAREVRFAAVAQAVGERIVDEQLTELREAQRVHEVFTELSLAEAGPVEILQAVQRLAGAALVLEDVQHRIVEHLPGPGDAATFLADWGARSRAVVLDERTAWDEASGWLLTRVGRPERGWGRLIIECADRPPSRLVATAERAAAALALHRLHDRQRDSLVRRTHHELLVRLLTDPGSPDVRSRCALAGVPLIRRRLVGLALRPHAGPLEGVVAATVHAVHELRQDALVAELDGAVRVLLSLSPTADPARVTDDLAARVSRGTTVHIGAGRAVDRAGEVDRTLREALHVLDSVRPGGPQRPVHRLEDVHLRGLLTMLADDDRLRLFTDRELEPLRQQDARAQSGLLDTVRALVRHPGSKSDAAAELHVSRSAFYDRLARVEHVLGVDLDDPDVLVSLHVAVLADELFGRR
ncbi:PucR family transcriptional regulator [Geodermatophilus nigrescens]